MRRRRRDGLAWALLAVVIASQACSAFDSDGSVTADAGTASSGDASTSVDSKSPSAPPPCDASERPESSGVFVSAAFGLPGGLGTPETPLRTIGDALEAAAAKGAKRVYVDEGTYKESLALTDRHAGISIIGGWTGSEAGWKKNCADGFRARTVLESPAPIAVRVTATKSAEALGLEAMTVTTSVPVKAAADEAGVSTVGIFVEGPAAIGLKIVKVVAARGGDAGDATPFAAAGARTCNGKTDCADGAVGGSGPTGLADRSGTFGPSGFVPGDGAAGGNGIPGAHGAQAAPPASGTCGTAATGQCNDAVNPPNCGGIISETVSAARGTCGCGGAAGVGGRPGRGGGASIGILVIGSGTVSAEETEVVAVGGGAGANGGAGQPGGSPTAGVKGNNATCFKAAGQTAAPGPGCQCTLTSPTTLQGSGPGGTGGVGGNGGDGGSGAGGPAHAWVTIGGGRVLEGAAFAHVVGPGGAGGVGAKTGDSSPSRIVELIADAGAD